MILFFTLCVLLTAVQSHDIDEGLLGAVSVRWYAPVHSPGGYSSEAITVGLSMDQFTPSLSGLMMVHHGDTPSQQHVENNLNARERQLLHKRGATNKINQYERGGITTRVVVCHSEPGAWHAPMPRYHTERCPPAKAPDDGQGQAVRTVNVGRTMFETDSIPDGWVSRLNYMDEVWVPTDAQADIFREAGVEDEKLHVVGEGVDTDFYKPTSGLEDAVTAAAADNPTAKVEKPLLDSLRQYRYKGFTLFLFVGKWEERKGVRVLLRAFYQEFGADERALLLVLTSAYHSSSDFDVQIDTILKEEGLLSDEREGEEEQHKKRHKVLLLNNLSQGAMPQLYSLASALVQPSKGEGWGRPHIESMSCGTPIIATDWSGPTAYLDANNGYPVEVERMESAASAGWNGHLWARPSEASLRQHMRSVHTRPDEALKKGRQARKDVLHRFSLEALAGEIAEQLDRIARATALEMRRGEGEL